MKQFGAKPTKKDIERYATSKNWDGKKFVNLEHTTMDIDLHKLPKLLYKQFLEKKGREPQNKIPIPSFDKASFLNPSDHMKFIWYGHAVVLLRMNNQTILIDPMFGKNAAPISPFPVKRFSTDTLDIIDELPEIDAVLLTHDHYDHLDYDSIERIKSKVKKYYVALGVARHLIKWGVEENKITELDWWDTTSISDIQITFTPTRHFSGRGLTDRAKSLWGGWVLKTDKENIWFSGDGGYGKHFKTIGEKFGPFDFAFMECGQYNENWHQIHMFPEESVQAAIDANVKKICPFHWGSFSLAQHTWADPADRFISEAKAKQVDYITPKIGEIVNYTTYKNEHWWE